MQPHFTTFLTIPLLLLTPTAAYPYPNPNPNPNPNPTNTTLSARDTLFRLPPDNSNTVNICYPSHTRCDVHTGFVGLPQPSTHLAGCLNIPSPKAGMGIHPSSELRCTLFFHERCTYGDPKRDQDVQGKWLNVYEGLEAPGIESFDTAWWRAWGFRAYGSAGKPPKSVLCWFRGRAGGLGGVN